MLGKLTVKPLLWTSGALVLVIAALSGALVMQKDRHKAAIVEIEAERDQLKHELTTADGQVEDMARTNETNRQVVEKLVGRLESAILETERLEALLFEAEGSVEDAHRQRDAALARSADEREADYANDKSCGRWAAGPVCGRVTAGLQDDWRAAAAAGRR